MIEKNLEFRGVPYRISHTECEPQDPSWFSFEDERTVRDRDWVVRPGDVVWDVGAAFGSYSLTALASGASAVVAWSPQAYLRSGIPEADYLAASLRLNGWEGRCHVHRDGVYDREGWLDCLTQEFHEGLPEVVREQNDLLRVRTLDSHVDRRRTRCDLLKLDVEGAEDRVLIGASLLLTLARPRAVLVEVHRFKVPEMPARLDAIMLSYGYALERDVPHHGVSHSRYVPA